MGMALSEVEVCGGNGWSVREEGGGVHTLVPPPSPPTPPPPQAVLRPSGSGQRISELGVGLGGVVGEWRSGDGVYLGTSRGVSAGDGMYVHSAPLTAPVGSLHVTVMGSGEGECGLAVLECVCVDGGGGGGGMEMVGALLEGVELSEGARAFMAMAMGGMGGMGGMGMGVGGVGVGGVGGGVELCVGSV